MQRGYPILLFIVAFKVSNPRRRAGGATPPPTTTPSSTAARWHAEHLLHDLLLHFRATSSTMTATPPAILHRLVSLCRSRCCLFNLLTDLSNTTLNHRFFTHTIDDRCVFFSNRNTFRLTRSSFSLFQAQTYFFRDNSTAC